MLAIEIEGGIWSRGRHTRGKGYHQDCEKYNEATILGWRILRFTPGELKRGIAALTIQRFFMTTGKMKDEQHQA